MLKLKNVKSILDNSANDYLLNIEITSGLNGLL